MAASEKGKTVILSVALALATVVAFASEESFSISRDSGSIDTSAKGDAAMTNTPGIQNVSCSVECLYVHSDEAQQQLVTQMKANEQVTLTISRWSGSAYVVFETATASITSLNVVHAFNENATYSAEFDIDGDFS